MEVHVTQAREKTSAELKINKRELTLRTGN